MSPRAPVYSKAQVQVKIEPMALFRLAIGVKSGPGRDPKLHDTPVSALSLYLSKGLTCDLGFHFSICDHSNLSLTIGRA